VTQSTNNVKGEMFLVLLPAGEAAAMLSAAHASCTAIYVCTCLHMLHMLLPTLSITDAQFVLLLSYILIVFIVIVTLCVLRLRMQNTAFRYGMY
jgi:hypothetical protein